MELQNGMKSVVHVTIHSDRKNSESPVQENSNHADDVALQGSTKCPLIGCYLRTKIVNRGTTNQKPTRISVDLRHQNGMFRVE